MLKCVLFDLDRTLLAMDQDKFVEAYMQSIAEFMLRYGFEPGRLVRMIEKGALAMLNNDGRVTNEARFWSSFAEEYGEAALSDSRRFKKFYDKKFDELSAECSRIPGARELVKHIKRAGAMVVLASNPVLPLVAMKKRMLWAGLDLKDFDYITSFENSHYCKPRAGYYLEIAARLCVKPEECLMVGNDVSDDMPAERCGMRVFLLPQYIINLKAEDISRYSRGGYPELIAFFDGLMAENNS